MDLDSYGPAIFVIIYVCLTAYLGWIVYQQYLAWRWGRACRYWPTTNGRILISRTTYKGGNRWITYGVKVVYTYSVNRVDYTGSRIRFGIKLGKSWYEARRIADSYKPNAIVKVHYHPEYPKLAVLKPRVDDLHYTYEMIISVIAIIFWALCMWALLTNL